MNDHDERDDYDDERWDRPLAPDHVVRWPANTMWAFGLLQLIFTQIIICLLVLVKYLVDLVDGDQTLAGLWARHRREPAFWLIPIVWLLMTIWTVLVMRAANDMRRYRRYWAAVTAAVMTMFSLPFFYLVPIQFPIAMWILFVLARRDVRARFEAVGAQSTGEPRPATEDPGA